MLNNKFFISDKVEERSIEMPDGSKEVVYFLQLPNTAFERYFMWAGSKDEDTVVNASPRLLAMGLCEADGKPAITLEDAIRLKRPLMLEMVSLLLEVNGYSKAADVSGNA